MATNLVSSYVTTFLCHPCYISEYVYLHIFRVNFVLKKHHSRGHRISCTAHHLEWTDNKLFSGLIGPSHIITSMAVVHQNCVARCSPCCIFDLPFLEAIKTVTAIIHFHCYCFMASGKWRSIVWYRNINITSFIFLSKNI